MNGEVLTQRRQSAEIGVVTQARLGDVCELNMGQSPESASYNTVTEGLPFYQGNADFGPIYPTPRVWCNSPVKIAEAGDLLVSVRAPIGALNFANERCCIGRGLAALRVKPDSDSKFIYYALKSNVTELNARGTGSTFKAISKKALSSLLFPLPPLADQRRIATKLDRLCDIVTKRKQQLVQLQQLVKSRFVEMFGDEKRFPSVMVGDVFTVKGPKRIHKAEWTSEGVPFYRVSNLSDLLEGRKTISDNFISRSRFEELKADEQVPAAGDVLVTARGTLGRCYVVKPHDEFYFQDGMITWLADRSERITLPYFLQAVQSQAFKRQYEGKSSGTTVAYMTIGQLAKYKLPLPPLALQREFAAFVAKVDKLAFAARQRREVAKQLYRAKIQEFFG